MELIIQIETPLLRGILLAILGKDHIVCLIVHIAHGRSTWKLFPITTVTVVIFVLESILI